MPDPGYAPVSILDVGGVRELIDRVVFRRLGKERERMLTRLFGRPPVPEIAPAEAHARQQRGALVIDVREPHEWNAGHIPGARLVPLAELPQRLTEFDPNQEIVLVCRSGNRSAQATLMLQRAGFTRVANLAGGMIAWTRAGLPVTR